MSDLSSLDILRERLLFLQGVTPLRGPEILRLVEERDQQIEKVLHGQCLTEGSPAYGSLVGDIGELTFPKFSTMWYLDSHTILAQGYCDARSRYYADEHLLQCLENSIAWVAPMLGVAPDRRNGFYLWDIYNNGAASLLLALCGHAFSSPARKTLVDFLGTVPSQAYQVSREKGVLNPVSGSNTLDVLYCLLLRGVALRDAQWIHSASAQLHIAMGRSPNGEGIQNDWSYHFHGHGINVAYGSNDLAVRAKWFFLLQDTPWQIDELADEFLGSIRDFFRYNLWKGRVNPYIMDRVIALPGGVHAPGMRETLQLALLCGFGEEANRMLAGGVRDCRQSETPSLHETTLNEVAGPALSDAQDARPILRYYPDSDYFIARRDSWCAAIRMCSVLTKSWDAQSGMHLHGSSSAEYTVALMTDGREYGDPQIATMNWRRLMGVTCSNAIEAPPMGYGYSSFVGGLAETAELGGTAMQYLLAPPGQDALTANKSVFVTEDALILLGNQIRSATPEPVITTLFHAPLEENGFYQCNGKGLDTGRDGCWELRKGDTLYLHNVAFKLLSSATLIFETREGCYASLNDASVNPGNDDEYRHVHRLRWCYLLTNHGPRPHNGYYGAVIWPGVGWDFDFEANGPRIRQDDFLHRIDLPDGQGMEVRFPGDWRKTEGLSYAGAEPFKWGHLAQWHSDKNTGSAQLAVLAPRRNARALSSATEVFLPDGFKMDHNGLMTLTGAPFPETLMSLDANGEVRRLTVGKT